MSVTSLVLRRQYKAKVWEERKTRADLPGLQASGHLQTYPLPFLWGFLKKKDASQPSNMQGSSSARPVSAGCSRHEGAEDKGQALWRHKAAGFPLCCRTSARCHLFVWHLAVCVISRACSKGKGDVCSCTKHCCVKVSYPHSSTAQSSWLLGFPLLCVTFVV